MWEESIGHRWILIKGRESKAESVAITWMGNTTRRTKRIVWCSDVIKIFPLVGDLCVTTNFSGDLDSLKKIQRNHTFLKRVFYMLHVEFICPVFTPLNFWFHECTWIHYSDIFTRYVMRYKCNRRVSLTCMPMPNNTLYVQSYAALRSHLTVMLLYVVPDISWIWSRAPLFTWVNITHALISNEMPCEVLNEITHPFPNFNCC